MFGVIFAIVFAAAVLGVPPAWLFWLAVLADGALLLWVAIAAWRLWRAHRR